MAFEKMIPAWNAPGVEPPESLKESGFKPGDKPPAEYFNWFMHSVSEAMQEMHEKVLTAEGALALDKVFCAEYGETTLADISEAVKAGKYVYCDFSGMFAPLMGGIGGLFFTFCCGNDKDGYSFTIDTSGWSYTTYGGYTPKAHADSHKKDGDDVLTAMDIGAAEYAVGDIYITTNSTSPAQKYGGTWEQIKDCFLLAAGSSYTAGSTGGAATHTLTANEMPSHTHAVGGNYKDTESSGAFRFESYFNASTTVAEANTYYWYAVSTAAGGNAAHNNMPPYLAVYMWRRVA